MRGKVCRAGLQMESPSNEGVSPVDKSPWEHVVLGCCKVVFFPNVRWDEYVAAGTSAPSQYLCNNKHEPAARRVWSESLTQCQCSAAIRATERSPRIQLSDPGHWKTFLKQQLEYPSALQMELEIPIFSKYQAFYLLQIDLPA